MSLTLAASQRCRYCRCVCTRSRASIMRTNRRVEVPPPGVLLRYSRWNVFCNLMLISLVSLAVTRFSSRFVSTKIRRVWYTTENGIEGGVAETKRWNNSGGNLAFRHHRLFIVLSSILKRVPLTGTKKMAKIVTCKYLFTLTLKCL